VRILPTTEDKKTEIKDEDKGTKVPPMNLRAKKEKEREKEEP